jgi:hypothetical protein
MKAIIIAAAGGGFAPGPLSEATITALGAFEADHRRPFSELVEDLADTLDGATSGFANGEEYVIVDVRPLIDAGQGREPVVYVHAWPPVSS